MKKDIINSISSLNIGRLVKIRYTKSSSGKIILYLEHYHDEIRDKMYLGASLSLNPEDRKHDEQSLRRVIRIRDAKEEDVMNGGVLRAPLKNVRFDVFAKEVIADKKQKNRNLYNTAINSFNAVFPDINLSDITPQDAKKYQLSIADLKACTVNHYNVALRHVCKSAIQEGHIIANPFADVKTLRQTTNRQFLTQPELQALIDTECGNIEVKRAFLFSCFTGLRWGDVEKLNTSHIQEGYLVFTQNKTGAHERIKLPKHALEIIADASGLLFKLPTYKNHQKHLKRWVAAAGITKHITFHCARHTFATLQIELGTDIYVLSKLMGHTDVKVTQVYAKLVDKKRDEAMDLFDEILDQGSLCG